MPSASDQRYDDGETTAHDWPAPALGRLRRLRERAGLAVTELAESTGISAATLNDLEAGAFVLDGGEDRSEPAPLPTREVLRVIDRLKPSDAELIELFELAGYPKTTGNLVLLGRRISDARESRHLTVSELARQSGVSRVTIGALEAGVSSTGNPARPSIDRLLEIARALALDWRDLLELADYEIPETDLSQPLYAESAEQRVKPDAMKRLGLLEHPGTRVSVDDDHDAFRHYVHDRVERESAVELPIWLALHKLRDPKQHHLRIVGVSHRAGPLTAKLVRSVDSSESRRPSPNPEELQTGVGWLGRRVAVSGILVTPTVLLLAHFAARGIPWCVEYLERVPPWLPMSSSAAVDEKVVVDVAYATGSLFHEVLKGHVDLAFVPSHPYVDDKREFLPRLADGRSDPLAEIQFDPLPRFRADRFPQTLVVTTDDRLRSDHRKNVRTRVTEIEAENNRALRTRREDVLSHGSDEGFWDQDPTEDDYPNLTTVVGITEPELLARELERCCDIGNTVGITDPVPAEEWRERIIDRDLLVLPNYTVTGE